jgi:hypothetical protein
MDDVDDFIGRRWAVDRIMQRTSLPGETILITGQPGAGKSRLARRVLEEVVGDERTRNSVTVWHECHANDDNTLVPWRLVTQMIKALSAASPEYVEALSRQANAPVNLYSHLTIGTSQGSNVSAVSIGSLSLGGESARSAMMRYVRGPLEAISCAPTLLVLIDGLDEANSPGLAPEFVDLVVHSVESFRRSRLDVRFVLTCRTGEHTVLERVVNDTLNLDHDEPNPGEDMHEYCRARLAGNVQGADELAWILTSKASGNYLYSRYAISLLNEPGATLETSSLPTGLNSLYEAFLVRRIAHDLRSRRWRNVIRPVLAVISVAREPGISSGDIATALSLPRSTVGDIVDDLREFLKFSEPTTCWQLFHESFRSFLHGWAPLKISAEEAHADLGRYFLEHPEQAFGYLRPNFAYHLNRAGLHAELCDYMLHADGALKLLRTVPASQSHSIWATACDSALELKDLRRMTALLAWRLKSYAEPEIGRSHGEEMWESVPTDAFGELGRYDADVVRNLVLTCMEALHARARNRAVERMSHMIPRCRYSVSPFLQHIAAALLADLHTYVGLGDLARKLGDRVLDHVGLATMQRFLIDRGEVWLALTNAFDTDSERYRFGIMKYAITMSERRRRGADAVTASHLTYATPRAPSWKSPTIFEDLATAAALPWIPRTGAGDLAGILRRVGRMPLDRAEVLSSVGRPEVAFDARRRETAIAAIGRDLRASPDERIVLWLDMYRAIAWRRHGHADRAHGLISSIVDRLPSLASAPDGHFVAEVHRDIVHGPCLQGLVLECVLELATLGDFDRSRQLAVELLEFGAEDGVTAFQHLIHQMHVRGAAESVITRTMDLLFALSDQHLPQEASDLAIFMAARAISALVAPSPALQGIAEKRLQSLYAFAGRNIQRPAAIKAEKSAAVMAASLAYAFGRSGDPGAKDRFLRLSRTEAARQLADPEGDVDRALLKYMALSDGASPITDLLRAHEHSRLKYHIAYLRDFLADRDDHVGVAHLNDVPETTKFTLSTACLEMRLPELLDDTSAAMAKCHTLTDSPVARILLLSYLKDLVTRRDGGNHSIDGEIAREVESASMQLRQQDRTDSSWDQKWNSAVKYEYALALARSGRVEEARRWHAAATSDYDASVEWYRIMGFSLGGDPYYTDRYEDSDYEEFEENVALNILDADRKLVVAMTAAGEIGSAREIVLAIAADRDRVLGFVYGSAAASLDDRIQTALRAAAESGLTDVLSSLLEQVRNRARVAAWIGDRIGDEPRCCRPAVQPGSLMRLAAATMGDEDSMMRALASLIVAEPDSAVELGSSIWLEILGD